MKKICTVTTSWDDGHTLDLNLAKLLKKYAIAGTFYVCPYDREFKKHDLLVPRQIRAISRDFEIGGHTMTHPHLTNIPLSQAYDEIKGCKTYLENIIGRPINSFCYPGGYHNTAIQKLVMNAGFRLGRTTQRYAFRPGQNPFALPTSFHAYNHVSDIHRIVRFSGFRIGRLLSYVNWEYLAMDLFDYCLKERSFFHLFGHSWELEKFREWGRLERVLRYISGRDNVQYVTNGEIEV